MAVLAFKGEIYNGSFLDEIKYDEYNSWKNESQQQLLDSLLTI
jgi:hypothetical protein